MLKMKFAQLYLFGFLLLILVSTGTAQKIQGIVYNDSNRNNVFDTGEQGIAGVSVSNQESVVLTDADGYYKITVKEESVIFITKPAGYATPLNKYNIPQFYYIHQPQGSPKQKYSGLSATGELPETLNFPLIKYDEPETFNVIVFSDPQPRDIKEIRYMRDDVIAELVGTPALFGVTLGDIMYDDLSLYQAYNSVIAQLGMPFYNISGNHDMNYDSADDEQALETFKKHFGPSYYSFNYGKVHFIVLDDVEWNNQGEEEAHYTGKLGGKQLSWLENDLKFVAEDKLIVFTMHIPFYTFLSTRASVNVVDRDKLFELIKKRKYLLALAGHMHMVEHQFLDEKQGWLGENPLHHLTCAAVSGTWWGGPKDERGIPVADQRDGTPNGYHMFTFTGNTYKERFKAAGKDSDYQLRISFPKGEISQEQLADSLIIVNVFSGNAKSIVECSIDNGKYDVLEPEIRIDPFFVSLYRNHEDAYPKWIEPKQSNHIWTGKLPVNLSPGVHMIKVRTVNQYGESFQAASLFEIMNKK